MAGCEVVGGTLTGKVDTMGGTVIDRPVLQVKSDQERCGVDPDRVDLTGESPRNVYVAVRADRQVARGVRPAGVHPFRPDGPTGRVEFQDIHTVLVVDRVHVASRVVVPGTGDVHVACRIDPDPTTTVLQRFAPAVGPQDGPGRVQFDNESVRAASRRVGVGPEVGGQQEFPGDVNVAHTKGRGEHGRRHLAGLKLLHAEPGAEPASRPGGGARPQRPELVSQ